MKTNTDPKPRRTFILYDGRACGNQGTDDASVLVGCDSDEEAQSYKGDFGGMACYSYAIDKNNHLVDQQWEWDYYDDQN